MLNRCSSSLKGTPEGPSGGRDDRDDDANGSAVGTPGGPDSESGRVLRFDPTLRNRKGARAKGGGKGEAGPKEFSGRGRSNGPGYDDRFAGLSGSDQDAFLGNGARKVRSETHRVRSSHSARFKIFKVLQVLGVIFALVVMIRTCGL